MTDPSPASSAPDRERLFAAAMGALERREAAHAQAALDALLSQYPNDPEALRLLGIHFDLMGNLDEAERTLRRARGIAPEDARIHNNLGSVLRSAGKADAAIEAFERACELAPDIAGFHYNLGKVLRDEGHAAPARQALERALELQPQYALAHVVLGDTLKGMGQIAEAAAHYREAIRLDSRTPTAWFGLTNLKTETFTSDEVRQLAELQDDPRHTPTTRVYLAFALARALEDHGRYAQAFEWLTRGNALQRNMLQWDAQDFSSYVAAITDVGSRGAPVPEDPRLGHEVILVVSLPRAGSTLIEQILASHSQVAGGGEISDLARVLDEESRRRGVGFPQWMESAGAEDWSRLGRAYLERTRRWRSGAPRFTDKALPNWPLLGAALRMLPGAHVIDCRRDPLETCFSCYRQLFARGQEFSYDIEELAAYWRTYDQAMRRWVERFPDKIRVQDHETLQRDFDAQVRDLLAFCELPFEPACLRFFETRRSVWTASAAQVRQPLIRDTGRAAHYGDLLDPLRAALARHGPA